MTAFTDLACPLFTAVGADDHSFELSDYEGATARWCPGCGDHSILTAVERLLVAEQLKPEQTVFVSGIGCSSRFPHYLKTYGFHGIHGRALPVATGVKLHRPDLTVFVVLGDGEPRDVIAGYTSEFGLLDEERQALWPLVRLRLAMSVCIAAHQIRQQPENEYLMISQKAIEKTLPRIFTDEYTD